MGCGDPTRAPCGTSRSCFQSSLHAGSAQSLSCRASCAEQRAGHRQAFSTKYRLLLRLLGGRWRGTLCRLPDNKKLLSEQIRLVHRLAHLLLWSRQPASVQARHALRVYSLVHAVNAARHQHLSAKTLLPDSFAAFDHQSVTVHPLLITPCFCSSCRRCLFGLSRSILMLFCDGAAFNFSLLLRWGLC